MRLPALLVFMLILFQLFIDTYIYIIARKRCKGHLLPRLQLCSSIILMIYLVAIVMLPKGGYTNSGLVTIMWMLFCYLTIYIPKLLFVLIDLLARMPRLWNKHRSRAISYTGGILASAMFFLLWWGALINRFRLDINEITIEVPGLPESFDGFRIVQFSDFHSGTYGNNPSFATGLVDKINSLEADAVFFTGDIVNRRTDELLPFVNELSKIESKHGVYSILGNHDYGDYSNWPSPEAKVQNMELMYDLQKDMGWKLLLNETSWIHINNDSIAVIGVENWGDPPFPCYGDLTKAYPNISDDNIKILLTHNPFHWECEIARNDSANVALTLSGHTHAMQMAVGHISPAALRYNEWGGLYHDSNNSHPLYVNIGIGTVGIPMRLGATPEITVFTLTKSN